MGDKHLEEKASFGRWPAPRVNRNVKLVSHNVLAPGETVSLSPFAQVRSRGLTSHAAKSAVRSLDILELLGRADRPLRAVEIASTLAISTSSAHQILKSMIDAAYLIFDPETKCYIPSYRTQLLVGDSPARRHFADFIRHVVADIHTMFRTTLTLSVRQTDYMQVVEVFEHPEDIRAYSSGHGEVRTGSIGLRIPIFGSSTGAAWLSAQSDAATLKAAQRCRRQLGHVADSSDRILQIAAHARAEGHALGGVSSDNAICAVAVPLPADGAGNVYVIAAAVATSKLADCNLLAKGLKGAVGTAFHTVYHST